MGTQTEMSTQTVIYTGEFIINAGGTDDGISDEGDVI